MFQLIADIETFCAAHGISESRLGVMVIGDKHLVKRLRRGGDVRVSTVDRVRHFMLTYRDAA